MNWSNFTSRIASGQEFNAYNSNYDDVAFKRHEPKFRTNKPPKIDNAALAMKHITTKGANGEEVYDEVSKLYFSEENMNRIQKAIKKTIFERTRGQFRLDENQDESDLLVTMRAVFIEHSRFLPFKVIHQVKELNRRTVEYIVPDMITEIKQAYGYIKEINEPIKPIPRPMNVNNAGRRTLPALTSAWGF
jgi:hypothetical protein